MINMGQVKLALALSLIVLVFYLLMAFLASFHEDYKKFSRFEMFKKGIVRSIAPILVGNFGFFANIPAIRKFIEPVMGPFGIATLGLVVGIILWRVRERKRDLYGQIELGFSILSFVWIGMHYKEMGFYQSTIAFFGAVYVFIRGLANIQEAKAKDEKSSQLSSLVP